MADFLSEIKSIAAKNAARVNVFGLPEKTDEDGPDGNAKNGSSIIGYSPDKKPVKLYYNPKDKKYYGKSDDGEIYGAPSFDQAAAISSAKADIRSRDAWEQASDVRRWSPEAQKINEKELQDFFSTGKRPQPPSMLASRYASNEAERAFEEARGAESGTPPSDESPIIQRSKVGRVIESAGTWAKGAKEDAGSWISGAKEDAGGWMKGAAQDTGNWVQGAVKSVGGLFAKDSSAEQATPSTDTKTTGEAPSTEPDSQQQLGRQNIPKGNATMSEEEKQKKGGGGSQWSMPYRSKAERAIQFGQEDFYPNPQDPAQYGYSTGLEVVARPGRLPMGAISKASSILAIRQGELDKKRQDFMAQFTKIPETYSPYQQNFARNYVAARDEWIQNEAKRNFVDEKKIYKEIYTNPELQAKWREFNSNWEWMAKYGKDMADYVQEWAKEAAKPDNPIFSTPDTRQYAAELLQGLGRMKDEEGSVGGNFDKLINLMPLFARGTTVDAYFAKNIAPAVKEFAQQMTTKYGEDGRPFMEWDSKTGKIIYYSEEVRKSFESQVQGYAPSLAEQFGMTIEEAQNYLRNAMPESVLIKTKAQAIPQPRAKGGGRSQASKIEIRPNLVSVKTVDETGKEVAGEKTLQAVPYKGGKPIQEIMVAMTGGEGPSTNLTDPFLIYLPALKRYVIRGKKLNEQAIQELESLTGGKRTEVWINEAGDNELERSKRADQVSKITKKSQVSADANAYDNGSAMIELYGTSDPLEVYSNMTNGNMSIDDIRENIKTEAGRLKIAAAMNLAQAPAATSGQRRSSTQEQFEQALPSGRSQRNQNKAEEERRIKMADEWEAMKKANPSMKDEEITKAVERKFAQAE